MTEWHCIERARERYGINLTQSDIRQIEARCEAGEGLTGHAENGAHYHLITFGDRVLWIVYKQGQVVTINPPQAGATFAGKSAGFMRRRKAQFKSKRPAWQ